MIFTDFTKDLIEHYILEEITCQMQGASSLLLNVAEEHQCEFDIDIVENSNHWIEYQRKNFCQLAMSDQMVRKLTKALELATAPVYSMTLRMMLSSTLPLPFPSLYNPLIITLLKLQPA